MPTPLYNRFGRQQTVTNPGNNQPNIIQQYNQLQKDPSKILDILLNNNKIDQQQYNELQAYKNSPWNIVQYLINHGNMK